MFLFSQTYFSINKLRKISHPATIQPVSLNWESTYAVALALKEKYPAANLQDTSLQQIYQWTIALDEFDDDPNLANDDILARIYQDWFEETLS